MINKANSRAYSVLILANIIYATSYVATRLALNGMPPATLAFVRLLIAGIVMLPLIWGAENVAFQKKDHGLIACMGIFGFGAAFLLANFGLAASTATNAALLIVVEPVSLMFLGPALLGERLLSYEIFGALIAVGGSVFVVFNGVPGLSAHILPHWRGDALLALSGLAYASYSLIGRPVLERLPVERVTVLSIFWGAAAMFPFAVRELVKGQRPIWSWSMLSGTLYLALIVTALGFLMWNWALKRVEASRAGIFLNIQPVAGALLATLLLKERLSVFVISGGLLSVMGLLIAFRPGKR